MLTVYRPRLIGSTLLAGALLLTSVRSAHADQIDVTLLKNSSKILNKLREAGYQNVGVLKFQVEKGEQAPSYFAGRLPTLMATRLENVLILANDTEKPIGVTRAASSVAATSDKDANYETAGARTKLLEGKYPLAWGKSEVKVDAFLTGLVKLSKDFSDTTISIRAFDAKNLEPRELFSFTVPTNRLLLADMDQKFFVTKRELNGLVPIDEKDADKVAAAAEKVPAKLNEIALNDIRGQAADPKSETFDQVLDFKVFYDDKEVQRGADLKLPTPQPGQKVHFTLKSTERLGVVLRINGVNTLGAESDERDPDQYSMWVLQPGKPYTVDAFYGRDGKRMPIKVLPDNDSTGFKLADETKRGKIELHVYRQVKLPVANVNLPDVKFATFREPAPRMETVMEAQKELLAMKGPRQKGLAVPGDNTGKVNLNESEFNNIEIAGCMTITYFEKRK